jgi:hypothetical protein
MVLAKAKALEDGEDVADGPEGESEMFVRAAVLAMEDVYDKAWTYGRTIDHLLASLPDTYRESLAAKARIEIVEQTEEEPTEFSVTWWSVHLLAEEIRRRNATPPTTPAGPF